MSKKPKGDPAMQLKVARLRLLRVLRAVCQPKKDPRLTKKPAHYERFRSVLNSIRNLSLLLLKGHVLIEEAIFELILTISVDRQELEDIQLQFSTKLRLARAFGLIHPGRFYDATGALNRLRNDMAHHAEVDDLDRRVDEYLAYFTDQEPKTAGERLKFVRSALAMHMGFFFGLLDVHKRIPG